MWKWFGLAVVGLGCNALFEENPDFTPDSDGSTSAATASGMTASGSTTSGSTTTSIGTSSGSSAPSSESGDVPDTCEGIDMYEPNDSESQLAQLPSATSQDVVSISAQLAGAVDEDWFKQPLEQAGATQPQPTVVVAAPEPVRVCVYLSCSVGETAVDCGTHTPDSNGNNTDGCCGEDEVSLSYTCAGAVDLDASTLLRFTTAGPTEACVPYDFDYDFGG